MAVWVCYFFTLSYPFIFDDFLNIAGNPSIQDIGNPLRIIRFNPLRLVTYFTFALNYLFGQNNVTGYHIVNILIHSANSILVWMLVRNIYSTPLMKSSIPEAGIEQIALFTALVFAVHPLATESVTYMVQRLVSLSSMFFLISVNLYLQIRSGENQQIRSGENQQIRSGEHSPALKAWLFTGLICSSLLAFFSRENTWVLFVILLLAELTFYQNTAGHKQWSAWLLILNIFLFLLITAYVVLSGKYFKPIPPIETHQYTITVPVYYLTQVCVICSYLGLLVFPYGQVFDRDFTPVFSVSNPGFILCSLILLAFITVLILLRKKQPVLFFSLAWFLITLLPQSLVPRPNFFFEHRLYLPSAGIFIVMVSLLFHCGWRAGFKPSLVFLVLIPALASLAILRNLTWHDELSLWNDTVRKSPANSRAWNNLGHARYDLKDYPGAETAFRNAINITPRLAELWYNLALTQQMQNKPDTAINSISAAISLDPGKAMYFNDRGVMLAMNRNYTLALDDFTRALSIAPHLRQALLNRARVYDLTGDTLLRNKDLRNAGEPITH